MKNKDVENLINKCISELKDIAGIKKVVGDTSQIMRFLTRYALIKSCGTIEFAYKTLIADYCGGSQTTQIKNYLDVNVRSSSSNPTMDNIYKLLSEFDISWKDKLKKTLQEHEKSDKITLSLHSLNFARNEFAHGGDPNITFNDVVIYFKDSYELIKMIDSIFDQ